MSLARPPFFAFLIAACALTLTGLAEPNPSNDGALAQSRAQYPLQICIVSGEHLNPGEVVDYIYHEEGKPDRLVRFCCRKCLARFKKDPARFVKKLDEVAEKKL